MSLSQNGFTFGGYQHGLVRSESWDVAIVRGKWFGVKGESHIIHSHYGRVLRCRLMITGRASHAALKAELDVLDTKIGLLTGTLTMTLNGVATPYPAATFKGYLEEEPGPFQDASGVNGWCIFVDLIWQQRTS
ncbi:MAG: hypothetical protein KY476_00690 [Planctomycetes bacterium]|nr:hypothetical protein [Planctomycetota bacterium]